MERVDLRRRETRTSEEIGRGAGSRKARQKTGRSFVLCSGFSSKVSDVCPNPAEQILPTVTSSTCPRRKSRGRVKSSRLYHIYMVEVKKEMKMGLAEGIANRPLSTPPSDARTSDRRTAPPLPYDTLSPTDIAVPTQTLETRFLCRSQERSKTLADGALERRQGVFERAGRTGINGRGGSDVEGGRGGTGRRGRPGKTCGGRSMDGLRGSARKDSRRARSREQTRRGGWQRRGRRE